MVNRQGHAKPVMIEAVQFDPLRIGQWGNDDRGIQRFVQKTDDLGCRGRLSQFQAHIRPRLTKRSYRIGQSPIERAADIAQPDKAGVADCGVLRHADCVMRLTKRLTRFTEKGMTCGGQAQNPVAATLDQNDAQILFQPFDRNRQRWLGHSEAVSRPMKMLLLRDGDELLHLAQVDHAAARRKRRL